MILSHLPYIPLSRFVLLSKMGEQAWENGDQATIDLLNSDEQFNRAGFRFVSREDGLFITTPDAPSEADAQMVPMSGPVRETFVQFMALSADMRRLVNGLAPYERLRARLLTHDLWKLLSAGGTKPSILTALFDQLVSDLDYAVRQDETRGDHETP